MKANITTMISIPAEDGTTLEIVIENGNPKMVIKAEGKEDFVIGNPREVLKQMADAIEALLKGEEEYPCQS